MLYLHEVHEVRGASEAELEAALPLLTRAVPEEFRRPGTWMHEALSLRDRWQSRLLRAAPWSPWS
jgi:hypothetical protein